MTTSCSPCPSPRPCHTASAGDRRRCGLMSDQMNMNNSIFRDKRGKYCTATYKCAVQSVDPRLHSYKWLRSLWPRSYGKNVTASGLSTSATETHWYFMISNTKQTTRADVLKRIRTSLQTLGINSALASCEVVMALPERGASNHAGTPRKGTKRSLSHATQAYIIVAQ